MTIEVYNDGETHLEYGSEDGTFYVRRQADPTYRKMVRESTEKLRQAGVTRRDIRLALQMTQEDYLRLGQMYPEIIRGNAAERRRAWEKIAKEHPQLVAVEFRSKYHGGQVMRKRGHEADGAPPNLQGVLRG